MVLKDGSPLEASLSTFGILNWEDCRKLWWPYWSSPTNQGILGTWGSKKQSGCIQTLWHPPKPMINIHRLTLHLSPLLTLKKCILNQDKVQRDVILPLHSLATKNMDQQVKRPTGTARKPVNWASPLIDTKNKGIATSDIPTLPAHESVQIAAGTSADTWASRGKFSQQPQYRQKTSNEVLEPFTLQCDNRTMHLGHDNQHFFFSDDESSEDSLTLVNNFDPTPIFPSRDLPMDDWVRRFGEVEQSIQADTVQQFLEPQQSSAYCLLLLL